MDQYLKKLIGEGENQKLDFKYCVSDSRKIARTLAAFANTDGIHDHEPGFAFDAGVDLLHFGI